MNGITEKRHTKVPIGRPVGGGRPGRRNLLGKSIPLSRQESSYKNYIETRRRHYGLTALGKREQAAKEKRAEGRAKAREERRDARLKRANERAEKRREAQKRRAAPKPRKTAARKAAPRKRRSSSGQSERDYYRYLAAKEDYDRDVAARHYKGWSMEELRSEALDYGIRDERRDYKKMSRAQLAEWLYEHRGASSRY